MPTYISDHMHGKGNDPLSRVYASYETFVDLLSSTVTFRDRREKWAND